MIELAYNRVNVLRKAGHVKVLQVLDEGGEMCVDDIVARVGVEQSWVSQMLKELAALGYVERRKEAKGAAFKGRKWMFYRVNYKLLRRVCRAISEI